MASTTSQRSWMNWAWDQLYGYEFDDWAADRIERGVAARQLAREVAAMTGNKATVAPNTLSAWYPALGEVAA